MNRKGKLMPWCFKSTEGQCTVCSSSGFPVLSLVHSTFSRRWQTTFWNKSVCVCLYGYTNIHGMGGVKKFIILLIKLTINLKNLKITWVAVLLNL